jgi:hypothetical protein
VSSVLFLVIYGLVTGLAHSPLQALSSAVKMPLLFIATMAFCLPALYFFSLALLRTQLGMWQVTAVVLAGISVTAFLLLGLAPVTLFFDLTSENYAFFQLLAVVFVAISGFIGLYYLWVGMAHVNSDEGGRFDIFGRVLLVAWIVLYAFVGSQMTWRLSPFIADPEAPFAVIQPSRDNFYVDVLSALERASGVSIVPMSKSATGILFVGFLLTSVLCLPAFGVGVFIGWRARRKGRASAAVYTAEKAERGALGDIALKAKYAPHSGSA